MAERKTEPTDASVEEFLNTIEPERIRQDAITLDQIFQEVTSENPVMWGDSIVGYGSQEYFSRGRSKGIWPPVSFSPRKDSLVLYGLKDYPTARLMLPTLGRYRESKGCIYFKKLIDVDLEALKQLIALSYEYSK